MAVWLTFLLHVSDSGITSKTLAQFTPIVLTPTPREGFGLHNLAGPFGPALFWDGGRL